MSKKKINVDDMVEDILKAKSKRPKNWVDRLEGDAKEFMFKLRKKAVDGIAVNSIKVSEKLEQHFEVRVSDNQVRRFLRGELHAEEDFKEESSNR